MAALTDDTKLWFQDTGGAGSDNWDVIASTSIFRGGALYQTAAGLACRPQDAGAISFIGFADAAAPGYYGTGPGAMIVTGAGGTVGAPLIVKRGYCVQLPLAGAALTNTGYYLECNGNDGTFSVGAYARGNLPTDNTVGVIVPPPNGYTAVPNFVWAQMNKSGF